MLYSCYNQASYIPETTVAHLRHPSLHRKPPSEPRDEKKEVPLPGQVYEGKFFSQLPPKEAKDRPQDVSSVVSTCTVVFRLLFCSVGGWEWGGGGGYYAKGNKK